MVIRGRFSMPSLVVCDQHGSQVSNIQVTFLVIFQHNWLYEFEEAVVSLSVKNCG